MLQICGFYTAEPKKTSQFPFCATGHGLLLSTNKMEPRHGIVKAFPKVKRAKVLQGKDAPPLKRKLDECDVTGCYFIFIYYALW